MQRQGIKRDVSYSMAALACIYTPQELNIGRLEVETVKLPSGIEWGFCLLFPIPLNPLLLSPFPGLFGLLSCVSAPFFGLCSLLSLLIEMSPVVFASVRQFLSPSSLRL